MLQCTDALNKAYNRFSDPELRWREKLLKYLLLLLWSYIIDELKDIVVNGVQWFKASDHSVNISIIQCR